MPNWKKVVVSGSAAHLASLNITGNVLISGSAKIGNQSTDKHSLTGSLSVLGSVSGSFSGSFRGSGTGLTGIVSSSYAVSASWAPSSVPVYITASYDLHHQVTPATTWSVDHNLNSKYPVISVWDTNDEQIIPEKIVARSVSGSYIYFPTAVAGKAGASSGTVVSIETASYALNALTASYAMNGGGGGGAVSSYTNSSDNRVITSTGGSGINGESNLTFDGSLLTVTGRADVSGPITGSNLRLDGTLADGAGETTVLVLGTNGDVRSDEIDSRAWGTSLVNHVESPENNQVAIFTGTNSITGSARLTFSGASGMNILESFARVTRSTGTQLALGYDFTKILTVTVNSAGAATFNLATSGQEFTFSDPVNVPEEAYGTGWNGNTEVPTKNAVYDKMEAVSGSVSTRVTTLETTPDIIKGISIESPTNSEKIIMFFTPVAFTVSEIRSVVIGTTPSVTFSIRYGTDVSAAGTEVVTSGITVTNTTTGTSTTSFNNASIPADQFVWITTSATSGTVTQLHVTVTNK